MYTGSNDTSCRYFIVLSIDFPSYVFLTNSEAYPGSCPRSWLLPPEEISCPLNRVLKLAFPDTPGINFVTSFFQKRLCDGLLKCSVFYSFLFHHTFSTREAAFTSWANSVHLVLAVTGVQILTQSPALPIFPYLPRIMSFIILRMFFTSINGALRSLIDSFKI